MTEPSSHTISVVIAHYASTPEHRAVLVETVRSIRRQSFPGRVEIAVSDDGSVWSAPLLEEGEPHRVFTREEIVAEPRFEGLDIDLFVLGQPSPRYGKALWWNIAAKRATSDYLVFLDDDHAFTRRDALALFYRYLGKYRFVMGRLLNPTRAYRLYNDRSVQGTTFAMRRELLEAVGGFGEETADWARGEDADIFHKVYVELTRDGFEPRQALYAGEIITVDRCSGRWRGCSGGELEDFYKGFAERHGVRPRESPCRDKTKWMDHSSPHPERTEWWYRTLNGECGPDTGLIERAVKRVIRMVRGAR